MKMSRHSDEQQIGTNRNIHIGRVEDARKTDAQSLDTSSALSRCFFRMTFERRKMKHTHTRTHFVFRTEKTHHLQLHYTHVHRIGTIVASVAVCVYVCVFSLIRLVDTIDDDIIYSQHTVVVQRLYVVHDMFVFKRTVEIPDFILPNWWMMKTINRTFCWPVVCNYCLLLIVLLLFVSIVISDELIWDTHTHTNMTLRVRKYNICLHV